jgi:hypothetical protein
MIEYAVGKEEKHWEDVEEELEDKLPLAGERLG